MGVVLFQDDEPEFSEAFTIEIVSASLISDGGGVAVPVGGVSRSTIFIEESDSPKGEIQFQNTS